MDAIAFIWKTLLTKVSIKPLVLSMSFHCFSLWPWQALWAPSPSVLFPQPPLGLKEPFTNCLWAGSPSPTAALTPTRAGLIFPRWSDTVA